MNIEKKVIDILENITGNKIKKKKKMTFKDMAMDSLRMVTLLVMIEDEFNIVLDESDMDPFVLDSVSDVVTLVSKYLSDEVQWYAQEKEYRAAFFISNACNIS